MISIVTMLYMAKTRSFSLPVLTMTAVLDSAGVVGTAFHIAKHYI